mmetsp:Transcript_3493/g.6721  ORF Transcript_3493/g.6721 Transcript_3493/m.6721 type:complete len:253 (-) Transcript_3493:1930-2688(-)
MTFKRSRYPSFSAYRRRIPVGSAPWDRTNIQGVLLSISAHTSSIEAVTFSANSGPSSAHTNDRMAKTLFSSRNALMSSKRWNCDIALQVIHLSSSFSSSPSNVLSNAGSAVWCICNDVAHSSQPPEPCQFATTCEVRPEKVSGSSASKVHNIFHVVAYFSGMDEGKCTCVVAPRKNKPHSVSEILPAFLKTCTVNRNEKWSLCFSNKPRHTFLYTNEFKNLKILSNLLGRESSWQLSSMHFLNSLTKYSREY